MAEAKRLAREPRPRRVGPRDFTRHTPAAPCTGAPLVRRMQLGSSDLSDEEVTAVIAPTVRPRAWLGSLEVVVALVLAVVYAEKAHALTFLEDIVFPPTQAEARPIGLEFGAQTGPTGGPYRDTAFSIAMTATEARGAWARRDNVLKLCYNFDNCSGNPLLLDEHAFDWTWEASFKPTASAPTWIENNVNVRYVDGSYHRPWSFIITTETKRASLSFLPIPGKVKFHINSNGNVAIGTPVGTGPPARQLEVFGDARVTKHLQVDGKLTVAGLPVVTSSDAAGQGIVRWAVSDGGALSYGEAVCSESGLACDGTVLPGGDVFDCDTPLVAGTVLFALCR